MENTDLDMAVYELAEAVSSYMGFVLGEMIEFDEPDLADKIRSITEAIKSIT